MDRMSRDRAARAALVAKGLERAKGYSWKKTAELTWAALKPLLGHGCD